MTTVRKLPNYPRVRPALANIASYILMKRDYVRDQLPLIDDTESELSDYYDNDQPGLSDADAGLEQVSSNIDNLSRP